MTQRDSIPAPRGGRRMRVDARRNRERVLDAAEAVFAELGTSAPTEEIARRAGVGIGTVFRHFPTKEALLEAVFVGRLRELVDEADDLLAADDPGAAFVEFFTGAVERSAAKNAYVDALTNAGIDVHGALTGVRDDLLRALTALLTRAQEVGAVRDDIGVSDLIPVLVGASRAVEHADTPAARSRALAVILDGLRARE